MTRSSRLLLDELDTPIGRLALLADEEGRLRALWFTEGHARMERQLRPYAAVGAHRAAPALVPARNPGGLTAAVAAYFEGDLSALDGLPVEADGTPFQRAVWGALREIPCGATRSYGEIARRIGNPAAVRAVGLANGANPVGIVVPCHRVIGANGTLTGYGGGIERKRWLLAHERVHLAATAVPEAVCRMPASRSTPPTGLG
ncbi:MAG: methylated-DNA--[protein]-cysteine S-methyltransferase [Myxococcales bacterium]